MMVCVVISPSDLRDNSRKYLNGGKASRKCGDVEKQRKSKDRQFAGRHGKHSVVLVHDTSDYKSGTE